MGWRGGRRHTVTQSSGCAPRSRGREQFFSFSLSLAAVDAVAVWSLPVVWNLWASGQHAASMSSFKGVCGALGDYRKLPVEYCAGIERGAPTVGAWHRAMI